MLSVKEAKELLFGQIHSMSSLSVKVTDALGYVLAEDVFAPFDMPSFDQSAMDGYAIHIDEILENEQIISLPVVAEIKAGDKPFRYLEKNTAIRIFTGAAVPENTTCIVIQEKTERKRGRILFSTSVVKENAHIRRQGSQTRMGDLALSAGTLLNPAGIGWLCSLGFTTVTVIAKPEVSVLATGNELKKPGSVLSAGQIYESNSYTLKAALDQSNFKTVSVKSVPDQHKKTYDSIRKMLSLSDVVIISGGISVGKYDLVKDTLTALGVEQVFYKVAQKPGKPMFVGKYTGGIADAKTRWVFALPGNPAASLVCFYEYVLPVLKKLSGSNDIELRTAWLPLADSLAVKGDRDLFLRAKVAGGLVHINEGQESNMMHSFAGANAIVFLPIQTAPLDKGTLVETHFIP
ncbi:MAG: gephyrin-like molybdotransferase Glp [Saprospiraceae bacterium]